MKKIVRSDAEVALDEVTEGCKGAADHYQSAAGIVHDPELQRLFAELESERRTWAQALDEEVRRLGNLPSAPDADRESLEHLVIRLRALLTQDEEGALLHESQRIEERLGEQAASALAEDLPSGARTLAQRIARGTDEAQERLSPARR